MNIMELEYFYRGGGVGMADINRDGRLDLLLGGNMSPSRLYLNKGQFQFEDISEASGFEVNAWVNGISFADVNQDGWMDIYLSVGGSNRPSLRKNRLFLHQGLDATQTPRFVEVAASVGLASPRSSTQAAFFDFDRDGDLDLFVANTHPTNRQPNLVRTPRDGTRPQGTDQLFQNLLVETGKLAFEDVSQQAGIRYEGFSLGLAVSDINLDGWPDLYLANDHVTNDVLYLNQGDGTFQNVIEDAIKAQSYYSMGVFIKDVNGDGKNDIFTLDMLPERNDRRQRMVMAMSLNKFSLAEEYGYQPQFMKNALNLQVGTRLNEQGPPLPRFSELGQLAGIHNTDWSWGSVIADFDHNGHNDIVIANGYPRDITDMDFVAYQEASSYFEQGQYQQQYREALRQQPPLALPNQAFSQTAPLRFQAVADEWGLGNPNVSNGVAYGDLDQDGDLDLVINHLNQPASVLKNQLSAPEHHFLALQPLNEQGVPALGAKVFVKAGSSWRYQELYPVQGYQSFQAPVLHMGLGATQGVDSVLIGWPDGSVTHFPSLGIDQTHRLTQGEGEVYQGPWPPSSPPGPFSSPLVVDTLAWKHEPYVPFDDFYIDPLLPQTYSTEPPLLATADVDGNGTLDAFVGSGARQKGQLFVQASEGSLLAKPFDKGGPFEDMDAAFLDADQDGDPDLYVASGGIRHMPGHPALQDRLYLNQGGHFSLAADALPNLRTFTKSVVPFDMDGDGDEDLFVGGRLDNEVYTAIPASYLLMNEGGTFSDASELLPEGGRLGWIASAEAADLNQDGQEELILAGEWQPIRILEQQQGRMVEITDRFAHHALHGWWKSVSVKDLNQDGYPDIIAGNLGLNNPYAEHLPLELHIADLDANGREEFLMGWHLPDGQGNRQNVPVAMRDDLTAKVPGIKTRYPSYSAFSEVSLDELLQLAEHVPHSFRINTLESMLLINQGGQGFQRVVLPLAAQWGPLHLALSRDFNGDGQLDLLCAGNARSSPVSMSWNEASLGCLLLSQPAGGYRALPPAQAGLSLTQQLRDGAWMAADLALFSIYGAAPLLMRWDRSSPESSNKPLP